MRTSPHVSMPAAGRHRETELAALQAAHWRNRHEIHALLDTVAVYRKAASALAQENLELRDELVRSRALCTRRATSGAAQTLELTLACDEFAPRVVALAVGEALEDTQSAQAVEAWQLIAFEMADQTIRTRARSSEAMLTLRMKHSPRAVGVEVSAVACDFAG